MRDIWPDAPRFRPLQQRAQAFLCQRRVFPRRLPGPYPQYACAFDQQEVGAGKPDAAGEADNENPCAPGDAAQAVLENLPADGIEHHIRTAPLGHALDRITERLAGIVDEMIGASRLRYCELLLR